MERAGRIVIGVLCLFQAVRIGATYVPEIWQRAPLDALMMAMFLAAGGYMGILNMYQQDECVAKD